MRITLKQIVFIIFSLFILKISIADPIRGQNKKLEQAPAHLR